MPQSFRCDSCAAPLEFAGGRSRFQRCDFCGNQMLVPAEVLDAFLSHQDLGGDLLGQARKIKEIKQLALGGNKIEAIKVYRETFRQKGARCQDRRARSAHRYRRDTDLRRQRQLPCGSIGQFG